MGQPVVLHGHVLGQLVSRLQCRSGRADISFAAMGCFIALDTQEIDLMDQRAACARGEYRTLHQVIESGLRQAWQTLLAVDGLGQLLSETAQPCKCAAGIDMQNPLCKTGQIGQQFVYRAKKFKIDGFHSGDSVLGDLEIKAVRRSMWRTAAHSSVQPQPACRVR